MKMRFVSMMVAACSMLAFVACKDGSGSGGGGTGGTGATGGTGTGATGGTGTGATGGTGTTGPTCMECACTNKSGDVDPGCADTCDNTISGAANPNFCNGSAALSQCEACIASRCGATSATCN